MNTYHPSRVKPETRERYIQATQTSTHVFDEREKLFIEAKALHLILNGNPPADLARKSRIRLQAIRRELGTSPHSFFRFSFRSTSARAFVVSLSKKAVSVRRSRVPAPVKSGMAGILLEP